jgi:hypothetical protein
MLGGHSMLIVLTWVKSRGAYATAGTVLEADVTIADCVADELISEALTDCTGDGDGVGDGDNADDGNASSGLAL